jgi:hypothetical protein
VVEFRQSIFPVSPEKAEEQYDRLHALYADKVMVTLRDLRGFSFLTVGFYIKVAQVMVNINIK